MEPGAAGGAAPIWAGADLAGAQPALLEMPAATFVSLVRHMLRQSSEPILRDQPVPQLCLAALSHQNVYA